jgi:hypothetical protein
LKKRKNECLFCTSRKCNHRIVSVDDGKTYDEIACRKHVKELYKHSDENASGIEKHHIETTGTLYRSESVHS